MTSTDSGAEMSQPRVRKGWPRAMLATGVALLLASIAGCIYGIGGIAMSQALAGAVVPLSTAWEQGRTVTHTGELTAGQDYAVCAGPKLEPDSIKIYAGTTLSEAASVPVAGLPDNANLADSYSFGVIECELRAVFVPNQSGVHTIVFKGDPVSGWATGVEVAKADAFYRVQPGVDRMFRGFALAALCIVPGLGLTIGGGRWLAMRRDLERALREARRTLASAAG